MNYCVAFDKWAASKQDANCTETPFFAKFVSLCVCWFHRELTLVLIMCKRQSTNSEPVKQQHPDNWQQFHRHWFMVEQFFDPCRHGRARTPAKEYKHQEVLMRQNKPFTFTHDVWLSSLSSIGSFQNNVNDSKPNWDFNNSSFLHFYTFSFYFAYVSLVYDYQKKFGFL